MSNSIANEKNVEELAKKLGKRIPEIANAANGNSNGGWTNAVRRCFGKIAEEEKWKRYPEGETKAGEFLLDFVLWQLGYGPRVVCESEWLTHYSSETKDIEWDFDKLRMVKGDIKVMIYEWAEDDGRLEEALKGYLKDIQLLSTEEAFLFLNFDHGKPSAHWWQPEKSGRQDEIVFKRINLD